MTDQLSLSQTDPPASFEALVTSIQTASEELSAQAAKAVNVSLTVRNWLIGYYIIEFEQHGSDRASYGDELLPKLSKELKKADVSRADTRELRRYRQFYLVYPQIRDSLSPEFQKLLPSNNFRPTGDKRGALSPISEASPIRDSPSPISGSDILTKLSFTHIRELIALDTDEKRTFYAAQCISGGWSVRELKRQIGSLLFERSELSTDKQKLGELTASTAETQPASLAVRDPYIFEFLGLRPAEVMSESHLEAQLLEKLQQFLLELGEGFCFEARQKRILIGDEHYFVDLVFYHRILKCHVLVELKLEPFSHENIGQLNTYVSWYDQNVRTESDNPPIGILLCTDRDKSLVEYALAGMSSDLFVSKYQLELPSKEVLQAQLAAERERLEGQR